MTGAPSPASTSTVRPALTSGPTGREGSGSRRGRLVVVLLVAALLVLIRTFVAEPLRIPSESMSPTLVPGEHVLAEKVSRLGREWQRGDLVAFHSPATSQLLVKRVVGVGGDTVGIRDGRLFVNNERVQEPYVDPDLIDSVYYGPVHVPDGEVLVMGDNRANSVDSRTFGTVPTSDIESRVVAVLWPPSHMSLIKNHWSQR